MENNKCTPQEVEALNLLFRHQHRQKKLDKTTQCTEKDLEEDIDSFEQFMTVLLLIIYLALIYYMASGWAHTDVQKQRFLYD